MLRWLPGPLAALALAGLAGCGPGAGPGDGQVSRTVTRDFGSRELISKSVGGLPESETVMRLLGAQAKVTTRYGGGFVQSVDGIKGGTNDGRPVDWFFFVNGREAPKGAAATKVRPGDAIWWDFRDWGEATNVPAVVGSFPEPFLHGPGTEKKLPVRVECIEVGSAPCRAVSGALAEEGVPVATQAFRSQIAEETIRVLVGQWAQLRDETSILPIEEGPRASGVYARPAPSGDEISLLSPDSRTARTFTSGAGIVAATAAGEGPPVWVVAGTDAAGLTAAASAFNARSLRNRYAVVVDGRRVLGAPEVGGRR
ncbi:MAG: DUF4430 domain-containing protein [Solirubrobacterales bacterium]